jgi:hypothetical protein
MATFLELQNLSTELIADSDVTATEVKGYINDCVNEIAGGMQSSLGDFITPPLPDLFTIGTVDTVTDAAFVSMPATFQRVLQFVSGSNGVEIDIDNSMIEFSEVYPLMDVSGVVREVIEHGGNIYYQGIPTSAETLTLHFYRLPVEMVADGDTPDGIPLHLQIPLIKNHVFYKIYEDIEDGIAGQAYNTKRYKKFFYDKLRVLELFIPVYNRSLLL